MTGNGRVDDNGPPPCSRIRESGTHPWALQVPHSPRGGYDLAPVRPREDPWKTRTAWSCLESAVHQGLMVTFGRPSEDTGFRTAAIRLGMVTWSVGS